MHARVEAKRRGAGGHIGVATATNGGNEGDDMGAGAGVDVGVDAGLLSPTLGWRFAVDGIYPSRHAIAGFGDAATVGGGGGGGGGGGSGDGGGGGGGGGGRDGDGEGGGAGAVF